MSNTEKTPGLASRVEQIVMCDCNGVEISTGDILFYTERPHSNYADSLVHVYEADGVRKVETVVLNFNDQYNMYHRDEDNDLPLENYSWDLSFNPTGKCPEMKKLEGVTKEMCTVEYASKHFPLDT